MPMKRKAKVKKKSLPLKGWEERRRRMRDSSSNKVRNPFIAIFLRYKILTRSLSIAETGEEGEETQFACKAKLFHFNGKEWKERGIGNFKLNVTKGAEEDSKPSARLIMRADGALRVILNTPVFKGMTVGDASGEEPTSKQVHLASLENGRSVPLLLRVSRF